MSDAIAVLAAVRDAVVILSAIAIAVMVVLVGRVFLRLTRRVEDMQGFISNAVTGVLNPIKGVLLFVSRSRRARDR